MQQFWRQKAAESIAEGEKNVLKKWAINRASTTTSLTPATASAEAQISPLNQLLSKSLDSSADCIRHLAITAAPAKQSLSKPKLIRAKVLNDGASCCRQHRYRTHSGSVMCRLAPQQSRLQHLKKRLYDSSLVSYVLSLQRTKLVFFGAFLCLLWPILLLSFSQLHLFSMVYLIMFLSAIELSSSYILPLQTTDKIGLLPPSGPQDKRIICACFVVRNTF